MLKTILPPSPEKPLDNSIVRQVDINKRSYESSHNGNSGFDKHLFEDQKVSSPQQPAPLSRKLDHKILSSNSAAQETAKEWKAPSSQNQLSSATTSSASRPKSNLTPNNQERSFTRKDETTALRADARTETNNRILEKSHSLRPKVSNESKFSKPDSQTISNAYPSATKIVHNQSSGYHSEQANILPSDAATAPLNSSQMESTAQELNYGQAFDPALVLQNLPQFSEHLQVNENLIPSDFSSSLQISSTSLMESPGLLESETNALEADSKELELDPIDLEALFLLAGLNQGQLQQLPALALLTGKLEHIDPQAIPVTMASTPLLQNILSSAEPAEYLKQVKPLGEWLQEFGWNLPRDDSRLAEKVELRQLLRSADIDPDRIQKEAEIIQATLPLEGMLPYMQRAERLNKNATTNNGTAQFNSDATQNSSLEYRKPEVPLNDFMPQDQDLLSALQSFPNSPYTSPEMIDASQLKMNASDLESSSEVMPLLQDFNPFAPSLAKMTSSDSLGNATPINPNSPWDRQNLLIALERNASKQLSPDSFYLEDTRLNVSQNPSPDWIQSLQAIQLQPNEIDAKLEAKEQDLNLDALFSPLSNDERGAQQTEFSNGEGSNSEDLPFMQQDMPPSLNPSSKIQNTKNESFQLTPANNSNSILPPHVVKEIFDKASLIIKDGGGAMRLDLGSKELGALDLAIQVKDNTVEIKIVASSQHTRELLATELPKLREALHNQNLNLDKVEIGLGGGSSFTQTGSDGRSFRQDQYTSQEETSVRGINNKGRMSRSYRVVTQENINSPVQGNHDGSIQVRI